ncbi:MAG: type II toxin-antitoxin system ParD family antitoxin [Saprospiraceae bacterium]
MEKIVLGKPYKEYIKQQIESGYYTSASEVIRDSLRAKMNLSEAPNKTLMMKLIEEGELSAHTKPLIPFTKANMEKIMVEAKTAAKKRTSKVA